MCFHMKRLKLSKLNPGIHQDICLLAKTTIHVFILVLMHKQYHWINNVTHRMILDSFNEVIEKAIRYRIQSLALFIQSSNLI